MNTLARKLKRLAAERRKEYGGSTEESVLFDEAANAIQELSKRVENPVSGVWERVPGRDVRYDFRCSVCHRFRFHNGELRRYKFCPNCGSPMKREDET